jgi:hypothetical protein
MLALFLGGGVGYLLGAAAKAAAREAPWARVVLTLLPGRTFALLIAVFALFSLYWRVHGWGDFSGRQVGWALTALMLVPVALVLCASRGALGTDGDSGAARFFAAARDFLFVASLLAMVGDIMFGYGGLVMEGRMRFQFSYRAWEADPYLLLAAGCYLPLDVGLGVVLAILPSRRTSAAAPARSLEGVQPIEQRPLARVGRRRPGSGLAMTVVLLFGLGLVGSAAAYLLALDASQARHHAGDGALLVAVALYLICAVPAMIVLLVWLYQSWDAVPAEFRSTSPGRAVGLLFVPIFGIYWTFRAIPGLSRSIARATRAADPTSRSRASFGLGVSACILGLVPPLALLSSVLLVAWVLAANASKNRMLVLYESAPPA